jgi:hypothetical protein
MHCSILTVSTLKHAISSYLWQISHTSQKSALTGLTFCFVAANAGRISAPPGAADFKQSKPLQLTKIISGGLVLSIWCEVQQIRPSGKFAARVHPRSSR